MKQTLYMYAMTCDTNFAPCIQNQFLTLACCKGGKKGGMRGSIGGLFRRIKENQSDEEIWVLGVCGKGLKNEAKLLEDDYIPIFMAKVTNVLDMVDYYQNKDYSIRADHAAYTVDKDKKLIAVKDEKLNPHSKYDEAIEKDINGKYVLCSDEFLYFGKSHRAEAETFKRELPDYFFDSSKGDINKAGIDKHCRGYIIYDDFECVNSKWRKFFDCYKTTLMTANDHDHLLEEFIPDMKDNEADVHRCSCAGGK